MVRVYDWETNRNRAASGAMTGSPNAIPCDSDLIFNGPRGDIQQLVAISGDGRTIVFPSRASNLVPGDVPNTCDLFVRQLGPVPQPALPVTVMSPTQPMLRFLFAALALAGWFALRRRMV